MKEDPYYLEDRTIFQKPQGNTFGFVVCEISQWITEPELVLRMLNAGAEALANQPKEQNHASNN